MNDALFDKSKMFSVCQVIDQNSIIYSRFEHQQF